MKCRGGLWSPSRSQRAADDNNHRLCLLYLQYLPLFPFLSASLYLTSPALFHHSRYLSGSRSLNMSFLFSFIYFNLHFLFFSLLSGIFWLFIFLSIGLPLSLCLLASPLFPVYLSVWHCIPVSFHSLLFEWVIWHFRKQFLGFFQRLDWNDNITLVSARWTWSYEQKSAGLA